MALDIYWIALLLLLPTVVLLSGRGLILRPFHRLRREKDGGEAQLDPGRHTEKDEEGRKFRRIFLEVYLLVMGSEWLQVCENGTIHDIRAELLITCFRGRIYTRFFEKKRGWINRQSHLCM